MSTPEQILDDSWVIFLAGDGEKSLRVRTGAEHITDLADHGFIVCAPGEANLDGRKVTLGNQGVGNCGYIDPLRSQFEDDLGDVPPWWVPLTPTAPVTPIQAWAGFLNWLTEPRRFSSRYRYPNGNPAWDRWHEQAFAVEQESKGRVVPDGEDTP